MTITTHGDIGLLSSGNNQASFLTKRLSLGGRRVTLAIWDTAGQERFHALGPIYYRDSNGACLIYDVTDEDSFQKVSHPAGRFSLYLSVWACLGSVGVVSGWISCRVSVLM